MCCLQLKISSVSKNEQLLQFAEHVIDTGNGVLSRARTRFSRSLKTRREHEQAGYAHARRPRLMRANLCSDATRPGGGTDDVSNLVMPNMPYSQMLCSFSL